jgi:hypothetical protein
MQRRATAVWRGEAFDAAVKAAETGCPVWKLFKAEISVDARLEVTA